MNQSLVGYKNIDIKIPSIYINKRVIYRARIQENTVVEIVEKCTEHKVSCRSSFVTYPRSWCVAQMNMIDIDQ